eukprot:GILJ01007849.1.p1 GENE.GILJ01007849.1~~GILJ01007849.1.p1  ORF type:complete len:835 (+),score=52.51 GILJ01007849.1:72-2576(+)
MSKWRVRHIAVEKGRSTALRIVLEEKTSSDEPQIVECLLPLDREAILNGYPSVEMAIRDICATTPIAACFPFDLPPLVSKVIDTLDIDEDEILEMKIRSCITEAEVDLTLPKVMEKVSSLEGDLALLSDCHCDKNMRKNLSFIVAKRCENRLIQEVVLHKPQIASDIVGLLSDDNTSIVLHVLRAIQLLIYKPHIQATEQTLLPSADLIRPPHDSIYDLALLTINIHDMRRDNCDILISADNADLIQALCQSVCVYCCNEISPSVDVNGINNMQMLEEGKRPLSNVDMPQDIHMILARARLVLDCILACSNDCLVLLFRSTSMSGRNIVSSIVTSLSSLAARPLAEPEQFSCEMRLFWILVQLYVTLESRLLELGCDLDFESVHRLFSNIIFSNCKIVDQHDGSTPIRCKLLMYSYSLLRCYKLFYTANSTSKALLKRCLLHNSNVLIAFVHIIAGCCATSHQLSVNSSERPFSQDTLQWYRTQLEADCSVLLCLFFIHNATNPLLFSLLRSRQLVLSKTSLHLPAAELKLKHLFSSCPHLQVSHSTPVQALIDQSEESVTILYILSPLQQENLQRFCLSRLKSQLLFNNSAQLSSIDSSSPDGSSVTQSQGIVEVLADIVCHSKSPASTIPVECLRLIQFHYASCNNDPLSVRHLFEWTSSLRTKVLNKLSDRLEIELFAEPVCEVGLSIIHQMVSHLISPSALRGSVVEFSGHLKTKPWHNPDLLEHHNSRQHAGVTVEKSDVAKLLADISSMHNLPTIVQSYIEDALQLFGHSGDKILFPQPPSTAHIRGFRRPATTQSVAVVIRPLPPATPRSMSSSGGQPLGFRRHQLR